MKKFILIIAVMSAALSITAQTGSLVREDRVWNYSRRVSHAEKLYENRTPIDGFHFKGSREENGKTYMVFRNADDERVALIRQDGGKVYLCVDDTVRKSMDEWGVCGLEEYGMEIQDEYLLYDFDARPGDKYWTLVSAWGAGEPSYSGITEFEVLSCYTINVNGNEYRCQVVRNNVGIVRTYLAVEGIGFREGFLCNPMVTLNLPANSFTENDVIVESVADSQGNVLFEFKDFSTDHVGIPNARRWEYVYASRNEDIVNMTMFYKSNGIGIFSGDYAADVIKWSYIIDEQTGELVYNNDKSVSEGVIEHAGPFSDKEGALYMTVTDDMRESMQYEGENDVLLYDFNAKEGDTYQTFKMTQNFGCLPSYGGFEDVTVLETGYSEIERQSCRVQKLLCNGREYTAIEGLGSEETGLIPYADVFDAKDGIYSGFRLNRVFNFFLNDNEEHVIYRSTGYIDVNNLGNIDGVESMFGEGLSLLTYNGSEVVAANRNIAIYDISGKIVAEGRGEVSTASLYPGIYVARAGGKSLKIIVRD